MKKEILLLIFFCFIFIKTHSQEQLKHEPKVYVSPSEKIYINKAQPIYFRVSVSPDPNAPSYVLPSENTAKYANPMYFDTEGRNTFRSPSAIDKVTKKLILPKMDVIFNMYADGITPQTTIKLAKAKQYNAKYIYFSGGLKTELKATDAVSGVETTYISINGEPYSDYSAFNNIFDVEKEYTLKYYSVDNVGNTETPKSVKFQVDLSAPKTSFKILGESKGKVLSSKASISLYSTDTLSGVDKIWYSINESKSIPYTLPIPIAVLKGENSKITYYATDKVGNKEEPKIIATFTGSMEENNSSSSFGFYIDKEAPRISLEIEGDQFKSKYLFISARSRIKIIAEDDKSGVEKISYSINNFTLAKTYTEPFIMTTPGIQNVAFAAIDYVGNFALPKSQQLIVDATIPVSAVSYLGNIFTNRDTIFITKNTQIHIKTSDNSSGIKEIKYNLDQENQGTYNTPLKVEDEGFHILNYQAIDNVNNTEELKKVQFFVDNSAPIIFTNFSTKAIGEKTIRDEKYTIYPTNVMLYIGATDNASGSDKIEYQINGNKQWQSTIPLKGFIPGNYEVEIISYDVLKNKSSVTVRFAIEN